MAGDLKGQIREQMQLKGTAELIEIWQKKDRREWSDEAFEVIGEILLERTGNLPSQEIPDDENTEAVQVEKDKYYDFNRILRIASWASTISWFFLGLAILFFILGVYNIFIGMGMSQFNVMALVTQVLVLFFVALISAFFFVLLQAISEGLYVLMDIEENTL